MALTSVCIDFDCLNVWDMGIWQLSFHGSDWPSCAGNMYDLPGLLQPDWLKEPKYEVLNPY